MKFILPFLLILSSYANAQFQVGSQVITYNDPARNNRAIECEIYYPADVAGANVALAVGEFPVIVFGHGFAMQVGAYPNWWNEFVPEGYIIVLPTTEGSFLAPDHAAFGADLQFLVNEMQSQGNNNQSPFFNRLNGRSAIMGHSMGGGATFLAAEGFTGADCIVGLAPAETNTSAIGAAANVSTPALIFSGTADGVTPPADHQIPIYDALTSDCKYFVSITEGSHCHYASNTVTCNLGEFSPGSLSPEDQRQVTYAVVRPWFEYFLKDDCDAWDDFQVALSTESDLGTINSVCSNDAPTIIENGGTLESSQADNYQWYLNGNEIAGADQQTYAYSSSGTYQVATVNIGSCPILSNEITVAIIGIVENSLHISSITNNEVMVSSSTALTDLSIDWFDTAGRVLESENLNVSGNVFRVQKPSYAGLKLLRIQSEDVSEVLKVY